jgi:hypothetical protein
MALARIVGVLLCLGIGASLILWMLTGLPRYRAWAWNLFRVGVVVAFIVLALFALERILATG